jgi:ADP-heptose:LPS heptosyltransferase
MKISAIVIITGKTGNLERCLRTLRAWTADIILVVNSSVTIKNNKNRLQILRVDNTGEEMIKRGIEAAKSEWVIVLYPDEEISIPLKLEIRSKIAGIKEDRIGVIIATNENDVWRAGATPEIRIFRRLPRFGNRESAVFIRCIRKFSEPPFPLLPIFDMKEVKKILVIKTRGIGDTVLSTPLYTNIKSYFKAARITCVANPASTEILKSNLNVFKVIEYKGFFLTAFRILLAGKFDVVICPQASLRTALLALASRSQFRVVNNHNGRNYFTSIRVRKPEEYEDAIDRDLDCLRAFGIPAKDKKVKLFYNERKVPDIFGVDFRGKEKIIGISVSASRLNKMWNKERFAELADKLINDYNYKVIFIDDPTNPEALKQVLSLMKKPPLIYCNRNVKTVMGLISNFSVFVGNDSGLLHIAAALSVPSVAIVGPEEADIFHPYSEKDRHFVLSAELECKPCWKKECAVPLCLDAISVKEVLKAVLKAVR